MRIRERGTIPYFLFAYSVILVYMLKVFVQICNFTLHHHREEESIEALYFRGIPG